jgi:transcription antitermination factor NusG
LSLKKFTRWELGVSKVVPILAKETDLFPANLLDIAQAGGQGSSAQWWALYTRSRREKQLMRQLLALEIPFFSPLIGRRYRSPNGRVRISYEPLFSNYVFLYGGPTERRASLTTNCVSQCLEVTDGLQLTEDLQSIERLIQTGCPLTPETRLGAGDRVRVKTGVFAGFEGVILRRDKETRLLVFVNFTQQGASVLLDDCLLQAL